MSLCLLEPIDWRLRPKHTISVCSFLFCYFLYFIFVYLYLLVNLLWRMNTFVKNQFKGLTYRFLSNHSSLILSVRIKEISAVNDCHSIKYINSTFFSFSHSFLLNFSQFSFFLSFSVPSMSYPRAVSHDSHPHLHFYLFLRLHPLNVSRSCLTFVTLDEERRSFHISA